MMNLLNQSNYIEEFRIFSNLEQGQTIEKIKTQWMKLNNAKQSSLENRSDIYVIAPENSANQINYGIKFRDVKQKSEYEFVISKLEVKVRKEYTKDYERWSKVVRTKLPNKVTIYLDQKNITQSKNIIKQIISTTIPQYEIKTDFHLINLEKLRFSNYYSSLSYEETLLNIQLFNEKNLYPSQYLFSAGYESKQLKDPEAQKYLQNKWLKLPFLHKPELKNQGYPEFLTNYALQQIISNTATTSL